MRSPIKQFLLFIIVAVHLAKSLDDGVIPYCNGFHPPTNPRPTALVFVIDHSIQQHQVDRIQYLYRAIGCELPTKTQVKIIDLNIEGPTKTRITEWMDASQLRGALNRQESHARNGRSVCARISSIPPNSLDVPKLYSTTTEPIPIHVFLVVDNQEVKSHTECDVRKSFQELAEAAPVNDPAQIHLDAIAVGDALSIPGIRVQVRQWEDIDTSSTKIGYAGQQDGIRSVFRFGKIMQQYGQLINSIHTEEIQNDVVVTGKNPRDLGNKALALNESTTTVSLGPHSENGTTIEDLSSTTDDARREQVAQSLKPVPEEVNSTETPTSTEIVSNKTTQGSLVSTAQSFNESTSGVDKANSSSTAATTLQLQPNRTNDSTTFASSSPGLEPQNVSSSSVSTPNKTLPTNKTETERNLLESSNKKTTRQRIAQARQQHRNLKHKIGKNITDHNGRDMLEAVEETPEGTTQIPHVVELDDSPRELPKELVDEVHNFLVDGGWKYVGIAVVLLVCFICICAGLIILCCCCCARKKRNHKKPPKTDESKRLIKTNSKEWIPETKENNEPLREYSPVTYGEPGANEVPEIAATAPISMDRLDTDRQQKVSKPKLARDMGSREASIPKVDDDDKLIF